MAEENVFFVSGGLKIEGLLDKVEGDKGLVVTHPHPLYGGSMHNNVVEAIVQAYTNAGYSALRFNFRGVGNSEGSYENGIGEQDDVKAALVYLASLGKKEIDLAGYSFGAWVNALGLDRFEEAKRLIMVSPPVNFIDFDFLKYSSKIKLVISGSADEIGGYRKIAEMLPKWNPEAMFRVIRGADHFYGGKTKEIQAIIEEFLDNN